jgi:deoxyribodipyrimidine photo-lyase
MEKMIYWFRNDLRLSDNAALTYACKNTAELTPVYVHDEETDSSAAWGIAGTGMHRRCFVADSLADLSAQLGARGSLLIQLRGRPQAVLPTFARAIGANTVVCETIATPQKEAEISALSAAGMTLKTFWQSSMLEPTELPFPVDRLPDIFTLFKQAVERDQLVPPKPLTIPAVFPRPADSALYSINAEKASKSTAQITDARSSFPHRQLAFAGGETAALAHVEQYFLRKLAHDYKATRNHLAGIDYSTKFSPWLAAGALSARTIYSALKRFENRYGANEGSEWISFELLWRDYFRLLHLKYGHKLYQAGGLSEKPPAKHDSAAFARWCRAETGEPLVDAGMRELATTGYLSNRLRQIVASYLVHDLSGDWRAGAAWFEAQLIDYDVYSNQGNWLYIAGRGTDPRGGRRFNTHKQARDYDPEGHYRSMWANQ